MIEEYANTFDILLFLRSKDFSSVGLKHAVTRKHLLPNKLEFNNLKIKDLQIEFVVYQIHINKIRNLKLIKKIFCYKQLKKSENNKF